MCSLAVFLIFLLFLPSVPESMFNDPDSYWHITTGDWIRKLGVLPESDPWSLSAGEKHWFIASWGWDVIASYLYEHAGWHGLIVMNSIVIAATLAVIFASSALRNGDGVSAWCATLLTAATLFDFSFRPHQLGLFCMALLMLLLTRIRTRRLPDRWLLAVPLLMMFWVNSYGGFVIGFFLLGAFFLEALLQKDRNHILRLAMTGIASLVACLVNPVGFRFFHDVLMVPADSANLFIQEWQGLQFSARSVMPLLYLWLFLVLVMMRPLKLARSERWIAYSWLAIALFSIRHLRVFATLSAPLLALGIAQIFVLRRPVKPIAFAAHKTTVFAMAAMALLACGWLFSASAARLYRTVDFTPQPELASDIAYIQQHYPHARLLNSYNLGGPIIFYTHGTFPVWIDGRAVAAYPKRVMDDYIRFLLAKPGWEDIFDSYRLDGALLLATDITAVDRLMHRSGWHVAFTGRKVILFMRDKAL